MAPTFAGHPLSTLLSRHIDTFVSAVYMVGAPRVYICPIDSVCISAHGLTNFISVFSDFVAQVWPHFPLYSALVLVAIPPQTRAVEIHTQVTYSHRL